MRSLAEKPENSGGWNEVQSNGGEVADGTVEPRFFWMSLCTFPKQSVKIECPIHLIMLHTLAHQRLACS